MKLREVKYTIIIDKYENGLPTYFVLKSVYFFSINMIAQLYGIDGDPNTPFQDLDSAETFKNILEHGTI